MKRKLYKVEPSLKYFFLSSINGWILTINNVIQTNKHTHTKSNKKRKEFSALQNKERKKKHVNELCIACTLLGLNIWTQTQTHMHRGKDTKHSKGGAYILFSGFCIIYYNIVLFGWTNLLFCFCFSIEQRYRNQSIFFIDHASNEK